MKSATATEPVIHHHHHHDLPRILRLYKAMPLWLKIPVLFGLLFVWGPAHVQNLVACLRAPKTRRLRVVTGPVFMLITPLISMGYLFSLLDFYHAVPGEILTWTYIPALLLMFIVLGDDVRFGNWAMLGFVVLSAFGALGWYGTAHNVQVFAWIGVIFRSFGIHVFPREVVMAITVLLSFLYFVRYVTINYASVLVLDGNLVNVKTIFARSPSNTRGTYSVVDDVRDFAELILGSATLHLVSKSKTAPSHNFDVIPGGLIVIDMVKTLMKEVDVETYGEGEGEPHEDDDLG